MDKVKNLERRLERYKKREEKLEKLYVGKETQFTFWGGYELGYTRAKIDEIENTLDLIKE